MSKPSGRAWLIVVFAAIIAGAWAYSLAAPNHFGSCAVIPLRFGRVPFVRDCQAYAPQDFVVPIALLMVVGLLVGDADFDVDGLGMHFSRRRRAEKEGRRALADLEAQRPGIDRRREEFLHTLTPSPQATMPKGVDELEVPPDWPNDSGPSADGADETAPSADGADETAPSADEADETADGPDA